MARSAKGAGRVGKAGKSKQTNDVPEDDPVESGVASDATDMGSVPSEAGDAVQPSNVDDAVLVTDPGADAAPDAGTDGPPVDPGAPETGDDETPQPVEAAISDQTDAAAPEAEAETFADAAQETSPHTDPSLLPAPVVQPRVARGPGFVTLLLGGVLAGAIGYALAYYDLLSPTVQDGSDPVAQLSEKVDQQAEQIGQLTTQVSGVADQTGEAVKAAEGAAEQAANAASQDDLAALRDQIAALEPAQQPTTPAEPGAQQAAAPDLDGLSNRLDDLAARVADLEKAPPPATIPVEKLDAYDRQLAELQQQLDAQRAAISDASDAADDARSAATDETRRISVRAALAEIGAALDSGEPFVNPISTLDAGGDVAVPPALADHAASGIATLGGLRDRFPPASRKALSVSVRETSGGSAMDRFGAFLRSQTGARSLEAREGDDPDAILSRAEAAVQKGDLETALAEIGQLPTAGQDVMADWAEDARTRMAAEAALDDLSDTLNTN